MPSIETITIDCVDPARVAGFWCSLLEYEVVPHPTPSIRAAPCSGPGPHLLFTSSGWPKREKNRFHSDLRPEDQDDTVRRAERLGGRRTSIGQSGDESWVVMADPEGNEFCILQSLGDLERTRPTT